MTLCNFCRGELGPDDLEAHAACLEEQSRRMDRGDCARCGERPAQTDVPPYAWCADCNTESGPRPYRGYPPEAS